MILLSVIGGRVLVVMTFGIPKAVSSEMRWFRLYFWKAIEKG